MLDTDKLRQRLETLQCLLTAGSALTTDSAVLSEPDNTADPKKELSAEINALMKHLQLAVSAAQAAAEAAVSSAAQLLVPGIPACQATKVLTHNGTDSDLIMVGLCKSLCS